MKRFGHDVIIGVSLNNVTGITGKRYGLEDLARAAREAEAMGFDAVWVHDAPLGRRTLAAFDPVTVLASIAGETRDIALCTGILTPHLRNPVMLALQWATLYAAAGGRAIMGAGLGAGTGTLVKREFQALAALRGSAGLDPDLLFAARGRLFDECLDVMNRLWVEDKVSYAGEFHRFDDVTLGEARPSTKPPVLVAAGNYFPREPGGPVHHGWSEKNAGKFVLGRYQRVAEHGDGWLTVHLTPDEYDAGWAKIVAHGAAVRPGRAYVKGYNCFVNAGADEAVCRAEVKAHLADFHGPPIGDDTVERWAVAGPPAAIAARLQAFIDRGVTIFQLVIGSSDQFGQMRRIAEGVLPLLRR
jgi:coenzyme F420-dependent glucose-6-phosphate dehydrogenase